MVQGSVEAAMRKLQDIEEIKKLKARYTRCLDKKLWDELPNCFTENATASYRSGNPKGAKNIAEYLKGVLGAKTVISNHLVSNPEIEILTENNAKGIWKLFDHIIDYQGNAEKSGYAYYDDEYVRENGQWKIQSTQIIRRLMDRSARFWTPPFA